MMSVYDSLPTRETLDGCWSGTVASAPDSSDEIEVIVHAFDDMLRFGRCKWMAKSNAAPARGNKCTVIFQENQRPLAFVWDTSTGRFPLTVMRQTITGTGSAFPDGTTNDVIFGCVIPGDLGHTIASFNLALISNASGNTAKFFITSQRCRPNGLVSTIDSGVDISPTGWTTNVTKVLSRPISGVTFSDGDILSVTIERQGGSGSDTHTGAINTLAAWVQY